MKKNVLSLAMGPPNDPDTCASSSGRSGGLMDPSVDGVVHDGTEGGQKFLVENPLAWMPPGRLMNRPSPLNVFVPDLVTMLNAGPAVQPYSAEKAFDSTVVSSIAPTGTVVSITW